jgi:hypothetical protein
MFARLVTGRYGHTPSEDVPRDPLIRRPGLLSRLVAAIFARKPAN